MPCFLVEVSGLSQAHQTNPIPLLLQREEETVEGDEAVQNLGGIVRPCSSTVCPSECVNVPAVNL